MKKNIAKMVSKIKKEFKSKATKPAERNLLRLDIDYSKPYRQRDMRQEAMDMGAHGSHEMFGKDQA